MPVFEISPTPKWSLLEWRAAAGTPSILQIIEIGKSLEVEVLAVVAARWKTSTVQSWLNGHIAERLNAYAMIGTLRESARRNGLTLFNDNHLRIQADIFMRSRACREGGFTPLDGDELAEIAGAPVPEIDPRFDDSDLLRKVFPPPPIKPFGRSNEIQNLLNVMRESLVTVIVSDPGNGKTTLAWHAARRAVTGGLVMGMDWNTDKRVMVTASGEERPINSTGAPLQFDTVISSAYRRFGWNEFNRVPPPRRPALITKRLSEGRYLLVVDNLETVPQAAQMVTDLRGLLEPRGDLEPLGSRALITSRVAVEDVPGVRHVHIGGLELEPAVALIRALEDDGDHPVRATESQAERLWQLTKGNPLLLQIALTRAVQQNGQFEEVLRDLDYGAGFMTVFHRLFNPLVKEMTKENPQAAFLAVYAALMPEQNIEDLRRAWDREFEPDETLFRSALATIIRCGVLRPVPGAEGEYAIHPMIRLYLRHLHL